MCLWNNGNAAIRREQLKAQVYTKVQWDKKDTTRQETLNTAVGS